ncbi:MAG: heme-dependent oxidative N-demethylase subunit alpha family protein, partial [Chloroflexota bacterium]
MFQHHPDHSLLFLRDDLNALTDVLWRIAAAIADDQPRYATYDQNGYRSKLLGYTLTHDDTLSSSDAAYPDLGAACVAYLQTLNGPDRLAAALPLSVQEDLVVMRHTAAGPNNDEAEVLLVAIPSHWDPAEKLGLSFYDIHVPVGDNARLLRASPNLMAAMIEKGPFVRYNWSLSSVSQLCQNPVVLDEYGHTLANPALAALSPREMVEHIQFRVERQTLLNFPDVKRVLFAIRVFQRPLPQALTSDEHAHTLAEALASMTPGHLAYRSTAGIIDKLVEGVRTYRQ